MNKATDYKTTSNHRKKTRRNCTHIRIHGEKAVCNLFDGVDCEYCSAYYQKNTKTERITLKETEKEININMNAQDMINIVMSNDFAPVILGDQKIKIHISRNAGITLAREILKKLGNPKYIEIRLNRRDRQCAVRACDENEKSAIRCETNTIGSCCLRSRKLLSVVTESMNIDVSEAAYEVCGKSYDEGKVIIFNFSEAVVFQSRKA